jgi:hypothetical protein
LFHCCPCLSFWTTLSNHQSLLQKACLLWPKIHYKNHYASVQLRSALQHTNIVTLIDTHIRAQFIHSLFIISLLNNRRGWFVHSFFNGTNNIIKENYTSARTLHAKPSS